MALNVGNYQSFIPSFGKQPANPVAPVAPAPTSPPAPAPAPTPAPTSVGNKPKAPLLVAPKNTIAPNQIAPKDLSNTYARTTDGTIYNKQSQAKFSKPEDFFKDSGQSSFNNLKFDNAYQPSGKESVYGQAQPQAQPQGQANPQPTPVDNSYKVNNGLYGQLITGLANRSSQPSQDYADTKQQAEDTQKEISDLTTDYRNKKAMVAGSPIDLSLSTGQQGILNDKYIGTKAGLESKFQGLTNLLGAANTQQGLQQQGLGTAAGFAKPELAGYNQQAFNPATGQFSGSGASESAVSGMVAKLKAETIGPQDALSQLSTYGQPALDSLNRQLGTNYNYNTASGSASAQGIVASGQAQTVAGYTSALQQGKNLQAQLGDLITSFNLNPSDINVVNTGLQRIAQNVSDPYYKQLQNYINDIANTYAQILTPPGGSSTDTSRGIASSMLDATASGTSILDTMRSLDNAAQAKIAGVPTATNSNPVNGGGDGGSYQQGQTAAGGAIVWDGSKWVVKK